MKKLFFLFVILFLTSYLSYAQNADFDNSIVKSFVPEYTSDNPLTTGTWTTLTASPHAVS